MARLRRDGFTVNVPKTSDEHTERVKRALEKGGWDAPLLWRKRKLKRRRKAQLEFRDENFPEGKQAEPEAPELAPGANVAQKAAVMEGVARGRAPP
jgi:hypothetical protein